MSSGTDQSEDIRNEVARIKRMLGLDVNRLAIGDEIEGLIDDPLKYPWGIIDFTIKGINTISFVNVNTNIGSTQTNAPNLPAQITGLSITVAGNNQLNLNWTISGSPGIISYNIYRSTISGSEILINSSVTNSFSDITVNSGTTYYYKISAVNNAGMEGTLSSEASATTTGTKPPMLELHFDDDFNDSSPNEFAGYWNNIVGTNGFTIGQFGSSVQFNTPVTPGTSIKDGINYNDVPELQMNTSIGFSFSCWIYPVDLTAAAGFRRFIIEKRDDANNDWSISIDPAGILYFFVKKAGTYYKRQISGFILNSWQHIGAVFNGTTNTVEVYRNGVAGVSSSVAEVSTISRSSMTIACRYNDAASTYYEGRLDELRYYQQVLTSTQINNLMNTNAT